jgi:HSP20 family protein
MTYLPTNRLSKTDEAFLPFDSIIDKLFEKPLPSFDNQISFEFFDQYDGPKVDIIDKQDSIDIKMEIPGVDKSEITAEIEGNILLISCEKNSEDLEEGSRYLRKEIKNKSFTRTFKIPDSCTKSKVSIELTNGILYASVPKKKPEKPKKLKIL